MSKYATGTNVSAEKSRAEIEKILLRYGAEGFFYGWSGTDAKVGFQYEKWNVMFELNMPDRDDAAFTLTPTGQDRAAAGALKAWEQATRQRWRALKLVIQAKLEAVESGITVFEEEFLAHIVMPNGRTFKEVALPTLERAYEKGTMPKLTLPGGPSQKLLSEGS